MNEKTVVLLSGGRDSLLAACLSIEHGFNIIPVICNNGHMEGIERAQLAVSSLRDRYGHSKVDELKQCTTGMTLHSYMLSLWYKNPTELVNQYPNLQMYQAHCLACKVSMYVHVLAFCKAMSIGYIVDGMRENQGFFVDSQEMHKRLMGMCSKNEVKLLTPVYNLSSDLQRKRMLCDRGMPTKTLEPQCFLGCPLNGSLSDKEKESLAAFFDDVLFRVAMQDILELTATKTV